MRAKVNQYFPEVSANLKGYATNNGPAVKLPPYKVGDVVVIFALGDVDDLSGFTLATMYDGWSVAYKMMRDKRDKLVVWKGATTVRATVWCQAFPDQIG